MKLLVHIDLFSNETSAIADYVLPAASGIEKGEIGRQNDDRRIVWIDRLVDPPGEAKPDGWIWIELGKRFGFDDVLQERFKEPAVFWDEVLIDNDQMRGITQARLHASPTRSARFPLPSEDAEEIETLYQEGMTAPDGAPGQRFATPSGKLEFWTEALEAKFAAHGFSALPEFYGERETLADLPYLEPETADADPGMISAFYGQPYGHRTGPDCVRGTI